MTEYWLVYDAETGDIVNAGFGPEGAAARQQPIAGQRSLPIAAALTAPTANFWVDQGQLRERVPAVSGAPGAMIRVNGGAPMLEASWPAPVEPGSYRVDYVGRYSGSRTITIKSEAQLLDEVDAENERRAMLVLTPGGAKKLTYAAKEREVRDYRGLLASAVNALGLADKVKRWPFAMAEVAASADSLATVIGRFEAGMTTSMNEVARLEAVAQKVKRAVRAASTLAAKRSAVAAINWG